MAPPSGDVSIEIAGGRRRARPAFLAGLAVAALLALAVMAFAAPPGRGSSTKSPPLKVRTSAGVFFIDSVVLSDRFPPSCDDADFSCELANRGYRVLTVWLKKGPGAKLNKLTAASKRVYVRASDGSQTKVFSSGYFSLSPFVAFTPRARASGFKLFWPGNPPILLPKPTVQMGSS